MVLVLNIVVTVWEFSYVLSKAKGLGFTVWKMIVFQILVMVLFDSFVALISIPFSFLLHSIGCLLVPAYLKMIGLRNTPVT